jgi:hypothetical protein
MWENWSSGKIHSLFLVISLVSIRVRISALCFPTLKSKHFFITLYCFLRPPQDQYIFSVVNKCQGIMGSISSLSGYIHCTGVFIVTIIPSRLNIVYWLAHPTISPLWPPSPPHLKQLQVFFVLFHITIWGPSTIYPYLNLHLPFPQYCISYSY